MSKQLSLLDKQKSNRGRKRVRPKFQFGGKYGQNYNPSEQRPIHANKALHIVLRSTQATGSKSFKHLNVNKKIYQIIKTHAAKNSISLHGFANGGNHLHLLIRAKRRDDYCCFIRSISGLIARLVGQSEKGRALKRKFWDARPFSRIVTYSKREYPKVKAYLLRNTLEALGWIPYIQRSKKLTPEWKKFWRLTLVET